jgi:hypothetical protein
MSNWSVEAQVPGMVVAVIVGVRVGDADGLGVWVDVGLADGVLVRVEEGEAVLVKVGEADGVTL